MIVICYYMVARFLRLYFMEAVVMKKNLVAMMVTVVMVAGALVGCGSKEVETVGGNGTTVEASAVEATVEENVVDAAASTEESVVEETVVEEVEKTAEEQLAEATVERTFRTYNAYCNPDSRYIVMLYDGSEVTSINCGEEDGVSADTYTDYQFILNLITSDEVKPYYEKADYVSSYEAWLDEAVSTVVEYRDDLGCFTKTYYADEEQTDIIAVDFIFVEQ